MKDERVCACAEGVGRKEATTTNGRGKSSRQHRTWSKRERLSGRSLPNAADCAKSTELERIVRTGLFHCLKNEALFRWLKEGQAATCFAGNSTVTVSRALTLPGAPLHTPVSGRNTHNAHLKPKLCVQEIIQIVPLLTFSFCSICSMSLPFQDVFFFDCGSYLGRGTWRCGKTRAQPTGSLPEDTT